MKPFLSVFAVIVVAPMLAIKAKGLTPPGLKPWKCGNSDSSHVMPNR
jgi:hypothetical protein